MKLLLSILLCLLINPCFGQLQIKPPKEDTMSNSSIAKWYADKYKTFLALSDSQKEGVFHIILANRNRLDSLNAKPNTTTDDLARNYLLLDDNLKTVLTDKQYYNYLNTSHIAIFQTKK